MTEKTLTITDPHEIPVTFVNQVVASGHLNGVANVTFVTARFTPGPDETVEPDLAISCRLRMDMFCAQQLHASLGQIIEQNKKPGAKAN